MFWYHNAARTSRGAWSTRFAAPLAVGPARRPTVPAQGRFILTRSAFAVSFPAASHGRVVAIRRDRPHRLGVGPGPASHLLKEEKPPMTPQQRRAAGRRRAWGRGPVILRFERLEGRQLLTTPTPSPCPTSSGPTSPRRTALNWGDTFQAIGTILNQGNATTTSPFNVEVYAATATTIDSDFGTAGRGHDPGRSGSEPDGQLRPELQPARDGDPQLYLGKPDLHRPVHQPQQGGDREQLQEQRGRRAGLRQLAHRDRRPKSRRSWSAARSRSIRRRRPGARPSP